MVSCRSRRCLSALTTRQAHLLRSSGLLEHDIIDNKSTDSNTLLVYAQPPTDTAHAITKFHHSHISVSVLAQRALRCQELTSAVGTNGPKYDLYTGIASLTSGEVVQKNRWKQRGGYSTARNI
jgi:hypothetical protein